MLIFWGCGEHAKPGQPVVIDFAKMSAGARPPGLAAAMRGLSVTPAQPPSRTRNATYGEWPNEQDSSPVPRTGSLVGEHQVQSTYAPDIKFQLGQAQDFLGPLNLTTNTKAPGGWANLGWNAVPNARAYLASAMGGDGNQMVLWTSSEVQASAFMLPDYIAPADLTRLVAARALMGPQTTQCAVPKEVLDAAPQAMLQMVAYGDDTDIVHPARPRDPKVAWNREWQVKVRYRSATGGLLGMTMPGMGAFGGMGMGAPMGGMGAPMGGIGAPIGAPIGQRPPAGAPQQQQPPKPSAADILRGLGGMGLGFPGMGR